MLGDAINGKLIDIPNNIMVNDIASSQVWECTRLVISNDVETQVERSECLRLIVNGLIEMSALQGAHELMSLSPIALTRTLRQLGFGAKRIGEPYKNDCDGRRYAVLSMPTVPTEVSRAFIQPTALTHPNTGVTGDTHVQ
jgi:acyl homoserine lactone synthase